MSMLAGERRVSTSRCFLNYWISVQRGDTGRNHAHHLISPGCGLVCMGPRRERCFPAALLRTCHPIVRRLRLDSVRSAVRLNSVLRSSADAMSYSARDTWMLTAKERSHDDRSYLMRADQSSQTTEMLWSFISRLTLPSMKGASKGFASPWNLQHVSCHAPLSFCRSNSLQSIPRVGQWHPTI
jgi:hypothetical protein